MTDIDVSNMTPEQRLKQIEILLSTLAKNQIKHEEKLAQHEERMAELELGRVDLQVQIESVTNLFERTITTMARQQEESNRRYQEHQAEIERIWQYLHQEKW